MGRDVSPASRNSSAGIPSSPPGAVRFHETTYLYHQMRISDEPS